LDALAVDLDLLRHKLSASFLAVCCCATALRPTTLAMPVIWIDELSRRQQRVLNTFTKRLRSKLLAVLFKWTTSRAGHSRRHYRRQREYPQPPPPTKNNTKITINRVSIISPLFGLSILNSVGALSVPDLVIGERLCFR
jgi:hypothetical protein